MQASRNEKVKRNATGDPVIGRRIRLARKNLKLTGEELANLVGASKAAVSQWESGATAIDKERIAKLSIALNIPLEQLVSVIPGSVILTGDAKLCHELFLELLPENRQALLLVLQGLVSGQKPPDA